MVKVSAKYFEKILERVMDNYEGEVSTLISGLYEILGNKIMDSLFVLDNEKYFNYYTDIKDYVELARTIGNDDVLWEEYDDQAEYEVEYKMWYLEINDEEEAKKELQDNGWRLATNGLAIGLSTLQPF